MQHPTSGINKSDLPGQSFVYFKGYQVFCIPGVFIWLFSPAFLVMIAQSIRVGGWIGVMVYSFLFVFWLWFFGRRMFYFGLSDEYLTVRMHNFYWIKRNFRLSDIKEVVIEEHYGMPPSLRIVTADFVSKAYPGQSLWGKKWRLLTAELKKKGIEVKNEEAAYRPGFFTTWDPIFRKF
jgi:hypothetical protein